MTGKYAGRVVVNTAPMKVVVFANYFPNTGKLTRDRWQIEVMGQGILANARKEAVVSPEPLFPFVPPLEMPDLSEEFSLQGWLKEKLHTADARVEQVSAPSNVSINLNQ